MELWSLWYPWSRRWSPRALKLAAAWTAGRLLVDPTAAPGAYRSSCSSSSSWPWWPPSPSSVLAGGAAATHVATGVSAHLLRDHGQTLGYLRHDGVLDELLLVLLLLLLLEGWTDKDADADANEDTDTDS